MRNAGQFALPLLLVLVGLPLSAQVQIPPELENEKPLANESAGNTAQRVQRENMEALKALRLITEQASDPDKVIQLAADFEKNFPKHHLLKSEVRTRASSAYFSKGDVASAVEAAKRSLEVVDCNIDSLLWSATLLSQEAVVAAAGPAPYARLNAASDYAKKSLDVMAIVRSNRQKTGTTQSSATDPKLRWTTREDLHNLVLRNAKDEVFEYWMKRDTAIARNVLGMVHAMQAERAQGDARTTELDRAAQELTAAASAAPSAPEYQMNLGNVYAMRGKDDDAIAAYSKVVKLAPSSPLQTEAQRRIDELKEWQANMAAGPLPSIIPTACDGYTSLLPAAFDGMPQSGQPKVVPDLYRDLELPNEACAVDQEYKGGAREAKIHIVVGDYDPELGRCELFAAMAGATDTVVADTISGQKATLHVDKDRKVCALYLFPRKGVLLELTVYPHASIEEMKRLAGLLPLAKLAGTK